MHTILSLPAPHSQNLQTGQLYSHHQSQKLLLMSMLGKEGCKEEECVCGP